MIKKLTADLKEKDELLNQVREEGSEARLVKMRLRKKAEA